MAAWTSTTGCSVAMYSVDPSLSLPNHGSFALGDVNCNGRVELEDAELIATFVANPSDASVSSLNIGQRGGYSLDPVTEMVWESILGTEKKDATVARLLHDAPVLISGVFDIDGRDYLYLGIDRDYYNRHGGKPIYHALKKRFPITPHLRRSLRRCSDAGRSPSRCRRVIRGQPKPRLPSFSTPSSKDSAHGRPSVGSAVPRQRRDGPGRRRGEHCCTGTGLLVLFPDAHPTSGRSPGTNPSPSPSTDGWIRKPTPTSSSVLMSATTVRTGV